MKSLKPSSPVNAPKTPYPSSLSQVTRASTTSGLSSITRILAVGTLIIAAPVRSGPFAVLPNISRLVPLGSDANDPVAWWEHFES
jgi:hypothetical protein